MIDVAGEGATAGTTAITVAEAGPGEGNVVTVTAVDKTGDNVGNVMADNADNAGNAMALVVTLVVVVTLVIVGEAAQGREVAHGMKVEIVAATKDGVVEIAAEAPKNLFLTLAFG